jgi:hypothetical protein
MSPGRKRPEIQFERRFWVKSSSRTLWKLSILWKKLGLASHSHCTEPHLAAQTQTQTCRIPFHGVCQCLTRIVSKLHCYQSSCISSLPFLSEWHHLDYTILIQEKSWNSLLCFTTGLHKSHCRFHSRFLGRRIRVHVWFWSYKNSPWIPIPSHCLLD